MPKLSFVLPGVPVAKGRPRMTKRGHVFTPKKTVSYEQSIALAAQAAKSKLGGGLLFDGPVMVTIHCHFAMPKSWSRKRKEQMLYEPHIQLPDLDNLVKSIMDGLNHTFNIWTNFFNTDKINFSPLFSPLCKKSIYLSKFFNFLF